MLTQEAIFIATIKTAQIWPQVEDDGKNRLTS